MKKKLELKKKVISSLTDAEKRNVIGGGDDAYTTSFSDCTYFICCGEGCPDPTSLDAGCPTSLTTCETDPACTQSVYPMCPPAETQCCNTAPQFTCS